MVTADRAQQPNETMGIFVVSFFFLFKYFKWFSVSAGGEWVFNAESITLCAVGATEFHMRQMESGIFFFESEK